MTSVRLHIHGWIVTCEHLKAYAPHPAYVATAVRYHKGDKVRVRWAENSYEAAVVALVEYLRNRA